MGMVHWSLGPVCRQYARVLGSVWTSAQGARSHSLAFVRIRLHSYAFVLTPVLQAYFRSGDPEPPTEALPTTTTTTAS